MNFANPLWLAALPPALITITILYFLKLKRREMVVSSTFLWRQAVQDLRVNSPFQKLRMNLLLILQLLIATLIIVTLARPRSAVSATGARDLILLIDRSASMGSNDADGQSRLSQAVTQASRLVNDMSGNDRAIVIAFDEKPEILASLTNNKRSLLKILKDIELSDKGTYFNEALERAFKISIGESENRPREVHLFSDGLCRELGRVVTKEDRDRGVSSKKLGELNAKLPKNTSLHYISLGSDETTNIGITKADLRRTLDSDAFLQLFVGIVNYTKDEQVVGVDILLNGKLVQSQEVTLERDAVTGVIFDSESLTAGLIEVVLDKKDGLELDNRAYTIAQKKEELKVLLVSPGNGFLEKALRTMGFVDPKSITPLNFNASDPALSAFDVIIFDRFQPGIMPSAGCLFINVLPPYKRLAWEKTVEFPRVVEHNSAHPVTAYLQFDQLEPLRMKPLKLTKKDVSLVDAEPGPMISVIHESGRDSVVLGFDILESRWPFLAEFPIFLANAIRWLGGAETRSRQLKTGQVAVIPVGEGKGLVKITNPKGKEFEVPIDPSRRIINFSKTDYVGFYKAQVIREGKVEREQYFAVNINDTLESSLTPRKEFKVAGREKAVEGDSEVQESNREIWRYFAWALLAFLLLEWYIYNRRVYV
ncbi:MAG: BatA and WFA domain-containing protein [Planctomycetota bacterium]|nr:BatA and WFA domain-containing protein [Planctomycetota bacterium]